MADELLAARSGTRRWNPYFRDGHPATPSAAGIIFQQFENVGEGDIRIVDLPATAGAKEFYMNIGVTEYSD